MANDTQKPQQHWIVKHAAILMLLIGFTVGGGLGVLSGVAVVLLTRPEQPRYEYKMTGGTAIMYIVDPRTGDVWMVAGSNVEYLGKPEPK